MTKTLFAAAAAIAVFAAGQASAAPADAAPTQALSTATVDFRDQAAVRAFYSHVRVAARQVCDSNSANPRIQQLDAACVSAAVTKAVRDTNRPLLTALYDTSGEARAGGYNR